MGSQTPFASMEQLAQPCTRMTHGKWGLGVRHMGIKFQGVNYGIYGHI